NIKPERNTEIESGVDATFGKEFATLSVQVYRKIVTDLLLVQSLAPSTGFATRIFNAPGAQLSDKGIEIAAAVSPVRTPEVNWTVRGTVDLSRSNIDSLPVPAFNTLGFGTSLGAFRIEQGKSATQIVGSEGHVGDANPDFRAGLSSDLTYERLSLGFTWEWKHGGDIINLTQLLYDAAGNSVDQVPAGNARISAWSDSLNPQTKVYVQDGSYLKLRELNVGYELPSSVPRHFGMRPGGRGRQLRHHEPEQSAFHRPERDARPSGCGSRRPPGGAAHGLRQLGPQGRDPRTGRLPPRHCRSAVHHRAPGGPARREQQRVRRRAMAARAPHHRGRVCHPQRDRLGSDHRRREERRARLRADATGVVVLERPERAHPGFDSDRREPGDRPAARAARFQRFGVQGRDRHSRLGEDQPPERRADVRRRARAWLRAGDHCGGVRA